ncbi:universal stress protein [Tsukamurella soli]|uniref:Universal stress protein n=1 Tax=Tsukamurella soli TaxID=644556 RepID=A0ABP8K0C6_9ACTN
MRLLVGYLATDSGADGVALGIRLARTLGASLDIATVVPPGDAAGYDDVVATAAQEWLTEAAATVPDDIATATHVVVDESFALGLIDLAERLDVEAIVVGAARDGLLGRHSIGSVTTELLHSSPVPLALAPRGARLATTARIRQVTCAIGTRSGAGLLLDTAVRAARATMRGEDGEADPVPLRLVSLIALDPLPVSLPDADEVRYNRARAHTQALLAAAEAALPAGFPVTTEVGEGPTIEDAAAGIDWQDGDLIMVGSSRLAMYRRLFLSTTAAKMLRVLQIPMVVVPNVEQERT